MYLLCRNTYIIAHMYRKSCIWVCITHYKYCILYTCNSCIYMHIYTYIYTYIYIHIYIYIYIYKCTYTIDIYVHIYICIHNIHICTYIYAFVCKHIHTLGKPAVASMRVGIISWKVAGVIIFSWGRSANNSTFTFSKPWNYIHISLLQCAYVYIYISVKLQRS
jgi:hypothetical protein